MLLSAQVGQEEFLQDLVSLRLEGLGETPVGPLRQADSHISIPLEP